MKHVDSTMPTNHDRQTIEAQTAKSHNLEAMTLTWRQAPQIAPVIDKPLSDLRVAIAASTGVHLRTDKPFILTGDASYRIIPGDADYRDLTISHVRYPNQAAHRDLDVVYPLKTLRYMAEKNIIGEVSPVNISWMGHVPRVDVLIEVTAKQIAETLEENQVDLVLLSPG
ncbi:glycine/sarcosine/betaine reductase selenoprotein B family protein [Aerococcus sanguinicola]|uniref:glycine/sarcosine/betaine reductase selenoprotein B family protein n=1 Tax=unclassified Aerococcus TaxID=2618060 RepID=UPI0008CB20EA|nr:MULTISPECIES: glycine/sarcosine/betaine reductase selenoprotein B family protein [unclassified Aerococcus]KAB0646558.1 hypothetical protein F6I01_06705 [Aerococcus sanguinicola]MDK6233776.1 glycine/sarcosine/betaine reductase selenoprotein B family protein [Aerococcus sp. UMB10185]MDK6855856.1 glycine/sarcosine/betaine reductase selenoprotein B family protein [Aerococcus sp. UMB7533]MDK8502609.1 glycine/sarcosine/betaine reductase selenoprotein B family protein [Aerococcus sp. UMB1112A]OFN0